MRPSQVRERVLRDHGKLRGRIGELERTARSVIAGERRQLGGLRARAEDLLALLTTHMGWEDRYLAPALEDADAWGPERAALLADDHAEQRAYLTRLIQALQDPQRPPNVLAASVLEWVGRLYRDMEQEEAFFLDPDVLRDDVVGINVETG